MSCLLAAPTGKLMPAERAVLAGYVKTLAVRILRNESRIAARSKERE
jgi:hypothetical protein